MYLRYVYFRFITAYVLPLIYPPSFRYIARNLYKNNLHKSWKITTGKWNRSRFNYCYAAINIYLSSKLYLNTLFNLVHVAFVPTCNKILLFISLTFIFIYHFSPDYKTFNIKISEIVRVLCSPSKVIAIILWNKITWQWNRPNLGSFFHKWRSNSQFIWHLSKFRGSLLSGILFYVAARYRRRPRVKLRPHWADYI